MRDLGKPSSAPLPAIITSHWDMVRQSDSSRRRGMWGTRMPHAVRMIRNQHRDYLQVLQCLCRLLDRREERGGSTWAGRTACPAARQEAAHRVRSGRTRTRHGGPPRGALPELNAARLEACAKAPPAGFGCTGGHERAAHARISYVQALPRICLTASSVDHSALAM